MTNLPDRRHHVEDHEKPLSVDDRRNPSPLDRSVVVAWGCWLIAVAVVIWWAV